MIATRRFFEMARKEARSVAGTTVKPSDNAISKNRPSLKGYVLAAIRFVKALAGSPCYPRRALPGGLPHQNDNAIAILYAHRAYQ